MYYLTMTARRKGAKRHKADESDDIQQLKLKASWLHKDYKVEIYDGRWNLIWTREGGDRK